MGGGGKGGTSTSSVSIPPEVLARYNAVNSRAEDVAQQPFQQYGGEFVAGLNPTQLAGMNATNAAASQAQPYFGAATQGLLSAQQGGSNYIGAATNQINAAQQAGQQYGSAAGQQYGKAANAADPYNQAATMAALVGAQGVDPGRLETGRYMNPYTRNVVGATQAAMGQQQGQQLAQQQAEAIRSGAFGGERAGLQRQTLRGQQELAQAQVIAPLYQQGYQQALQTAQQQQGVGLGAAQANRAAIQQAGQQLQGLGQGLYGQALGTGQAVQGLGQQQYAQGAQTAQQLAALGQQGYTMGAGASQQLAGLGTGAQQAALQGSQAQMAAGQVQQQTQQAQDTAQYQQFLQERGYPFQVAQFLANIAMGTGALSGSTTTSTQPGGFFSDKRLKNDVKEIGETHDGQPIYSYKYNGDDRTQIGLMAQDVEKKHPDAVGLMGGYKTVDYKKATEDAERTHKDMGGGLMPEGFDPNSMGGAVNPNMAGEGFERGGYVGGGLVGNDDWSQIVAANKAGLGVYGGAQPMGGGAPGATGIVPAASIPVPKLVTASAPSQQRSSGLSSAMQTGKDIAGAYKMGKEGLIGSAKTTADPEGSAGLIGGQGEWGGKNLFSKAKDLFAADGGLIVPRHAYADGGGDDSQGDEAVPYDPSDVMGSKDPMEGVLKAGSQKREMLKPANTGGGGGGGSSLGLGKMAGSAIGSAFGPLGSMAGGVLGGLLPFADGGLVPRQGYALQGATDVPADYSPEADMPSPNAQEAARYSEEDLDRAARDALALQMRRESGGDPTARAKTSSAAGLYQITDPTAKGLIQRNPGLGIQYDPNIKGFAATLPREQQEALGLALSKEHVRTLTNQGFEPTPQNVSANWFLGGSGGPALLKAIQADPSMPATSVAGPDAIRANQTMFFKKDGSPRSVSEVYSMLNKTGGGAPVPPGLIGAGMQPAAPSGEGKKGLVDTVTSEGFLVPALGFLGSMLASDKRNLGQALGEGIMGGVGAYQSQSKLAADIAKTGAETGQMLPVATARNIEAANKLAVGLMQYNASLPPGSKKLTLQEYAKVVGYTGPIPPSPEQTAQSARSGAENIASTDSRKWGLTPDEKESLVIKYPDGTAIPAYNDPSYLKAYANKFTSMGEGWAKEQADAASAAAEKNKVQTFDISGKLVTVPGAIEAGQKQKVGERLAEEAAEFNKEAAKYGPESQKIIGALNELETVLSQFRTGADAPARANLDRVMKAIDPENKFKLASSAAGDYDTVVKDAMFIGLSQLAGLSPRAPASELNAIRQTIPDVRLDPDAIRNIISKIKGDTAYKQKMYDAFDIDKNVNITKFQKEFMKDNPYDEFLKKTKTELRPGVGTQQQREQTVSGQQPVTISNVDDVSKLKPGTPFTIPSGPNKGKIGYAQ